MKREKKKRFIMVVFTGLLAFQCLEYQAMTKTTKARRFFKQQPHVEKIAPKIRTARTYTTGAKTSWWQRTKRYFTRPAFSRKKFALGAAAAGVAGYSFWDQIKSLWRRATLRTKNLKIKWYKRDDAIFLVTLETASDRQSLFEFAVIINQKDNLAIIRQVSVSTSPPKGIGYVSIQPVMDEIHATLKQKEIIHVFHENQEGKRVGYVKLH